MPRAKSYTRKIAKRIKKLPLIVILPLLLLSFFLLGMYMAGAKERLNSLFRIPPSLLVSASEKLSPKDLKEKLQNKNFTFINVHTPYEGEIAGTDMFLEYDGMVSSKSKLPGDKNAEIIIYCKTGRMSAEALLTLKSLGYTNIKHLSGGMDAWEVGGEKLLDLSGITGKVLPEEGFTLSLSWGDIGPRLVSLGVIDLDEFEKGINPTEELANRIRRRPMSAALISSPAIMKRGIARRTKLFVPSNNISGTIVSGTSAARLNRTTKVPTPIAMATGTRSAISPSMSVSKSHPTVNPFRRRS